MADISLNKSNSVIQGMVAGWVGLAFPIVCKSFSVDSVYLAQANGQTASELNGRNLNCHQRKFALLLLLIKVILSKTVYQEGIPLHSASALDIIY